MRHLSLVFILGLVCACGSQPPAATMDVNLLSALAATPPEALPTERYLRQVLAVMETSLQSLASDEDLDPYLAMFWRRMDELTAKVTAADRMELNVRILRAAMAEDLARHQPTVTGALLVYLVGDVLTNTATLDGVVAMHDFAQTWLADSQNDSLLETAAIVDAVASLGQEPEFLGLLSAPGPKVGPLAALQVLADRHAVFREAVVAVTGAPSYSCALITEASVATCPPALRSLAGLVQRSREWRRNWQLTQFFEPLGQRELHSGVHEAHGMGAVHAFSRQVEVLKQEGENLAGQSQAYLTLLQQATQDKGGKAVTQIELQRDAVKIHELRENISSLKSAAEAADARHSDFMADFVRLRESGAIPNGLAVVAEKPPTRIVAAHAPQNAACIGVDCAVPGSVHQVAAGQWVSISVSGQYSPLCALNRAGTIAGVKVAASSPGSVVVGSEGFYLQQSGNAFSAVSYSAAHEVSESTSQRSAMRVGAGAQLSVPQVPMGPSFLDVSLRTEVSYEVAHTTASTERSAHSTQTGNQSQMAAYFTNSLRLPHTPFPSFPAGSLLWVQVRDGQVVEADVVRGPTTTVHVTGDATAYLVVNDATAGCNADSRNALMVRSQVLGAQVEAATKTAEVMQQVLASFPLLGQSLDTAPPQPQTLAARRSEAMNLWRNVVGASGQEVPPSLQAMFADWLDNKLANVEARQTIVGLNRALDAALLTEAAHREEYAANHERSRLLQLQLHRARNALGLDLTQWRGRQAIRFARRQIEPLLALRYPEVRDGLRSDPAFQRAIGELTRPAWRLVDGTEAGSDASMVKALSAALTILANAVTDNDQERPHEQDVRLTTVAVAMPREPQPGALLYGPQLNPVSREGLWRAIAEGGEGTIRLRPQDLYGKQGQGLTANQETPVIRSMALLFEVPTRNNARYLTDMQERLALRIDPVMDFAGPDGILTFHVRNKRWLSPSNNQALFGPFEQAKTVFEQRSQSQHTARGLSPFAAIRVDFGKMTPEVLSAIRQHATGAYLMLQLETQACSQYNCMEWAEAHAL